jgi:UDP-N-acetylglucosamine 2-epimerase
LKIAAIVGARPNFVKIAPLVAEMRTRLEALTTLIHTGQHSDGPMSDAFFAHLELPNPDVNLHQWRRAADGQWPAEELPDLWDGKAARRLVNILLEAR